MQVCFYYAREGWLSDDHGANARTTEKMAHRLAMLGFMIDYAPGDNGKFFRVVVGRETREETIEGLVQALEQAGAEVSNV